MGTLSAKGVIMHKHIERIQEILDEFEKLKANTKLPAELCTELIELTIGPNWAKATDKERQVLLRSWQFLENSLRATMSWKLCCGRSRGSYWPKNASAKAAMQERDRLRKEKLQAEKELVIHSFKKRSVLQLSGEQLFDISWELMLNSMELFAQEEFDLAVRGLSWLIVSGAYYGW